MERGAGDSIHRIHISSLSPAAFDKFGTSKVTRHGITDHGGAESGVIASVASQ